MPTLFTYSMTLFIFSVFWVWTSLAVLASVITEKLTLAVSGETVTFPSALTAIVLVAAIFFASFDFKLAPTIKLTLPATSKTIKTAPKIIITMVLLARHRQQPAS